MKRIIIIIIYILVNLYLLKGQVIEPEFCLPSSNALELGKFGNTPVDLFTGAITVDVPVYTVKQGNISLPISLSYYGNGVKVDNHNTSLGLNWNLNAGGVITRKINDLPDDYDCLKTLKVFQGDLDFYLEEGITSNSFFSMYGIGYNAVKSGYMFNWENINSTDKTWGSKEHIEDLISNKINLKDTEADEFNFNFNGISGSFYFHNGNWVVNSDRNVKIENVKISSQPDDIKLQQVITDTTLMFKMNKEFGAEFSALLTSVGIMNAQKTNLTSFTLVTDDGKKYVFGNSENKNGVEYSISYHEQLTDSWTTSAWYLTEIISPTGDVIKLNYTTDEFTANFYLNFLSQFEVYKKDNYNCTFCNNEPQTVNNNIISGNNYTNPRFSPYVGSLIRPQYLSTITTDSEVLTFNFVNSMEMGYSPSVYTGNKDLSIMQLYNGNMMEKIASYSLSKCPFIYNYIKASLTHRSSLSWKKLSKIDITNSSFKKLFRLIYNNDMGTINERLMLKKILEYDEIGNQKNNGYTFDYYDNTAISLPGYLSESSDHWGYYNQNSNKVISNLYPIPQEFFYVNSDWTAKAKELFDSKEPTNSLDVALEGSLKSVIYPTGGKTEYEYEQHVYNKIFSISSGITYNRQENNRAGGIRIKKITDYNNSETLLPVIKEYYYKSDYFNSRLDKSPGILGSSPQYGFNFNGTSIDADDEYAYVSTLSYNSISTLTQNRNGCHIGYSQVIEKDQTGGFTIYKFTNFESEDGKHFDEFPELYNNFRSPNSAYTDFSLERGKLIEKDVYGNDNKLISSNKTIYEKVQTGNESKSIFLKATRHKCTGWIGIFPKFLESYVAIPYKINTYKYLPIIDSIKLYDKNGLETVKEIKYNYDESTALLLSQSEINSKDELYTTEYVYPHLAFKDPNIKLSWYNLIISQLFLTDPYKRFYFNMYKNNFINYPIEIIKYKNLKVIESKQFNYIKNVDNYVISDIYNIENTSGIANFAKISYNNSQKDDHYETTPTKTYKYDSKSNIIQIIDKGTTKFYIWSYNHKYPIAEIKNASLAEIESVIKDKFSVTDLNALSALPTPDEVKLKDGSLQNALPKALVTTYTYKPLVGMASSTDSRGVTTYYSYDYFNRLKETYIIENGTKKVLQKYDYHFANQ